MRITTTGNLLKLFHKYDKDTILRKRNIRKFIVDNVKYQKCGQKFVVDGDDFMLQVNPKQIETYYPIPRIRTITSAVKEFNKTHTQQINIHIIEKCLAENKGISYYKGARLYLINYDELEKEIIKQLRKRKGIVKNI